MDNLKKLPFDQRIKWEDWPWHDWWIHTNAIKLTLHDSEVQLGLKLFGEGNTFEEKFNPFLVKNDICPDCHRVLHLLILLVSFSMTS